MGKWWRFWSRDDEVYIGSCPVCGGPYRRPLRDAYVLGAVCSDECARKYSSLMARDSFSVATRHIFRPTEQDRANYAAWLDSLRTQGRNDG